jgi:hypothetical protein
MTFRNLALAFKDQGLCGVENGKVRIASGVVGQVDAKVSVSWTSIAASVSRYASVSGLTREPANRTKRCGQCARRTWHQESRGI